MSSWEDAADDEDAWEVNELPADTVARQQRRQPTTAPSGRRPWPHLRRRRRRTPSPTTSR